ncbi:hypothetical protein ZWY2020_002110 [Hordeum vulgare]|nr:hypothetical protein ZWY2020_002110 [Hordeum vulgare]
MLAPGLANADYNYRAVATRCSPGLANADYNYSGSVDGTLAPGSGNAHYDWPGLTMWHADELCDAALPLGHYPNFADGTLAPEYSGQVVAGGNYMKTLPSGGYPMAMGVGDNFTLGSNYTAHWQFQRLDTSSMLLGEMQT